MINYQNRWAVVTGASSGLGRGFAARLADLLQLPESSLRPAGTHHVTAITKDDSDGVVPAVDEEEIG